MLNSDWLGFALQVTCLIAVVAIGRCKTLVAVKDVLIDFMGEFKVRQNGGKVSKRYLVGLIWD